MTRAVSRRAYILHPRTCRWNPGQGEVEDSCHGRGSKVGLGVGGGGGGGGGVGWGGGGVATVELVARAQSTLRATSMLVGMSLCVL